MDIKFDKLFEKVYTQELKEGTLPILLGTSQIDNCYDCSMAFPFEEFKKFIDWYSINNCHSPLIFRGFAFNESDVSQILTLIPESTKCFIYTNRKIDFYDDRICTILVSYHDQIEDADIHIVSSNNLNNIKFNSTSFYFFKNERWTNEEISKVVDKIENLLDYDLGYYGPRYVYENILSKHCVYGINFNQKHHCDLSQFLAIDLNNLAIMPCPCFKTNYLTINKLGEHGGNETLMIATKNFNYQVLPNCTFCPILECCSGYCPAAANNRFHNFYIPVYNNCNLQRQIIKMLLNKYEETGLMACFNPDYAYKIKELKEKMRDGFFTVESCLE